MYTHTEQDFQKVGVMEVILDTAYHKYQSLEAVQIKKNMVYWGHGI